MDAMYQLSFTIQGEEQTKGKNHKGWKSYWVRSAISITGRILHIDDGLLLLCVACDHVVAEKMPDSNQAHPKQDLILHHKQSVQDTMTMIY